MSICETINKLYNENVLTQDEARQLFYAGIFVKDINLFVKQVKDKNLNIEDIWVVVENPEEIKDLPNLSNYKGIYLINGKDWYGWKDDLKLIKLELKERTIKWFDVAE